MSQRKQLIFFFIAVAAFAAATGVHDSIFNNYLKDAFNLSAADRGLLELPRELPGFLVAFMTGLLAMLAVTQLGVVGAATFAVGMFGVMLSGSHFGPMVGMMMVASAGLHLLQPTTASIAISLSQEGGRGARMGQMAAVGTLGTIIGAGFISIAFDKEHPHYALGFMVAAGLACIAAIVYLNMHVPELRQRRARLVVRKKFWLYYTLEALFGARKQIFITFGPWVLIEVYGQPARGVAQLLFVSACCGLIVKPISGMAIDRFGERAVMIADGLLVSIVCLGYGYAGWLSPDQGMALLIARICFIGDDLLFALGASRSVYASRLADSPEELTSTLSLGISINHVASMTLPAMAGLLWVHFGYQRVFLAGTILAIIVAAIATRVPGKAFWRKPAPEILVDPEVE